MTTSWKILVDWDRDGEFEQAQDDVSDQVIKAFWYLGVRRPYSDTVEDSKLDLILDNSDKRFSPENTSSPLYGGLDPSPTMTLRSESFEPHRINRKELIE